MTYCFMMHYFGICIILAQAMKPGLLATICVLYRMMPVDPHTVIPAEQSLAACLSKAPVTPPGPRPAPSYLGPLPINCGVAAAMPPPTPPLRSGNWIWSPPPPPPPPPHWIKDQRQQQPPSGGYRLGALDQVPDQRLKRILRRRR